MFRLTSACWGFQQYIYANRTIGFWGVHISHLLLICNVHILCVSWVHKKIYKSLAFCDTLGKLWRIHMKKSQPLLAANFQKTLPWMEYSITLGKLVICNRREWGNENCFMGILLTFEHIVKALLCTQRNMETEGERERKKTLIQKMVEAMRWHTDTTQHTIHTFIPSVFCILCTFPIVMIKSIPITIAVALKQMHAIFQWNAFKMDPFNGDKKYWIQPIYNKWQTRESNAAQIDRQRDGHYRSHFDTHTFAIQ